MKKLFQLFFIISIFLIPVLSKADVLHYKNLNRIDFDIYRNNKNIGKHIFTFNRTNEITIINSEINFEIKKLGVVIYKYYAKGTETYKDGQLIKFNSRTKQNKKDKYVNLSLDVDEYLIDGSSFKGKVSTDAILGTWWNHSITNVKSQISAVSGRIIKQKVAFLGKEVIEVQGKKVNTLHFNFFSSDPNLKKDKKLNTDVWYEEESLNWVKASFDKKGKWEYKLVDIK